MMDDDSLFTINTMLKLQQYAKKNLAAIVAIYVFVCILNAQHPHRKTW